MNLRKKTASTEKAVELLIDSPRLRVFGNGREFLVTERNAVHLGGDCYVDRVYSVDRAN